MRPRARNLTRLILFLIPVLAGAAPPSHPPRIATLFSSTNFRRLDRLEQLPEPVRTNLLSHFGKGEPGGKSVIANPKEPFNAGDAINISYPMRRLVFAGASDALWFVYYDHGGIAFHEHLVIYQRGVTEPVFSGTFVLSRNGRYRPPPATIDELKQWFTAGDITGDVGETRDW
jgi:hypothetical protein